MQHTAHTIGHPAPQREQVSAVALYAGLFGAPAAWVAQMWLSEILSSYACYPHRTPIAAPLWSGLTWMLAAVSIASVLIGVCALLQAIRAWQQSRQEAKEHAADIGEGRTKFFSMLALLSSALFLIAILFTACANLLVSPCGA